MITKSDWISLSLDLDFNHELSLVFLCVFCVFFLNLCFSAFLSLQPCWFYFRPCLCNAAVKLQYSQ